MAAAIYIMCAVTAALCAVLLLRGFQRSRARLLFWAGVCFVALAVNNIVLVIDRLILPEVDLWVVRLVPTLVGVGALVYGLVMETE